MLCWISHPLDVSYEWWPVRLGQREFLCEREDNSQLKITIGFRSRAAHVYRRAEASKVSLWAERVSNDRRLAVNYS